MSFLKLISIEYFKCRQAEKKFRSRLKGTSICKREENEIRWEEEPDLDCAFNGNYGIEERKKKYGFSERKGYFILSRCDYSDQMSLTCSTII